MKLDTLASPLGLTNGAGGGQREQRCSHETSHQMAGELETLDLVMEDPIRIDASEIEVLVYVCIGTELEPVDDVPITRANLEDVDSEAKVLRYLSQDRNIVDPLQSLWGLDVEKDLKETLFFFTDASRIRRMVHFQAVHSETEVVSKWRTRINNCELSSAAPCDCAGGKHAPGEPHEPSILVVLDTNSCYLTCQRYRLAHEVNKIWAQERDEDNLALRSAVAERDAQIMAQKTQLEKIEAQLRDRDACMARYCLRIQELEDQIMAFRLSQRVPETRSLRRH